MQCKECKTQIPDGVKYCPDCGAMVQADPMPQSQPVYPNSYDPAYQQGNTNSQHIPYTGQPAQKQKKKVNIPGIIISIIIAAVIPVVSAYFYSNRSGTGDAPKNDYENLAVSYFDNIFRGTDKDAVINALAVDFVNVYDDMIYTYSKDADATPEEYLDMLSDQYMIKITTSQQLLESDLDIVHDSFDEVVKEEFGAYTFSCSVADSDKITDEDLDYYYGKLDDGLSYIGKSSDDYTEKSAVTDAYKVKVELVIDGSKTSDDYTNIDEFEAIVVKTASGYSIIYDDYLIDSLVDWMTE